MKSTLNRLKPSTERSQLPLYDANTVAYIQRWFGLYPGSDADNGTQSQANGTGPKPGGSGDGDDEGTRNHEPPFTVRNKFWYYLFSFGAWLGSDSFYFIIFSLVISNLSWWVSRRVLLTWTITMYIGQAAKELLKWPRPSEPPVVRMERRYLMEYGMPSTHAMVGTLIPFTFLINTWNHYEYSHALGVVLASSWTALVCVSRLYKGMHFILDLVAGEILIWVLMLLLWPLLDPLDYFLLTHPQAPLIAISTSVFLCIVYPSQNGVASTRSDTICSLGAVTGAFCGFWFNYRTGMLPDVLAPLGGVIGWPGWSAAGLMLMKYLTTQVLTIIFYIPIRAFILQVISVVFNTEINERTKRLLFVELPYRYTTYLVLVAITYVSIPLLFLKLGWE